MAVGFDIDPDFVPFGVVPDGEARMPAPAPDENGLDTYTATLILADYATYLDLRAYHSKLTIQPALGGGGIVVVERGRGVRQLTYPTHAGQEATVYAALVDVQSVPRWLDDRAHRAEATFVVLGPVS